MTFLVLLKPNTLANLRAPKRDLEERLFYRRRASPRFYTAKTRSGHTVVRDGRQNYARWASISQACAVVIPAREDIHETAGIHRPVGGAAAA